MITSTRSLAPILDPESVAVIGASDDRSRIGGMTMHFLESAGYKGEVYPVNPRRTQVQQKRAYSSIAAVPRPVDLAVVAVPSDLVVDVIQECAAAGVGGAVVFSAGFAEAGESGAVRQTRIRKICADSGMLVLGPNCAGVMNIRSAMTATFGSHMASDTRIVPGSIALVSQSGAVGAYTFALARAKNVGLSYWVTTGNEVDTTVTDYVAAVAQDPNTKVIAVYLENMPNIDDLARAIAIAHENQTTVVALVAGRSAAASAALQSHSAAIATEYAVVSAALRDLGVLEVATMDELLMAAEALSTDRQPSGTRLGLISMSGAMGIMMLDRAMERGLQVPSLPTSTQATMQVSLPYASTANPVDITGNLSNTPHIFGEFLATMLAQDDLDAVVCFLGHVLPAPVGRRFVDDVVRLHATTAKPVWVIGMDDPERETSTALAAARVPLFVDPTRAIDAYADALWAQAQLRDMPATAFIDRREGVAESLVPTTADELNGTLSETDSQLLLAEVGVTFPAQCVVTSADQAEEAAGQLFEPEAGLVMKVIADGLSHKADAGGVRIGVRPAEAARTYDEIVTSVAGQAPNASISGVVLQQRHEGVPVLVAVRTDERFGPLVIFGAGGEGAELRDDSALALAPIDRDSAHALINRTRMGHLLRGLSGVSAEAVDELAELLVRLSQFACAARRHLAGAELNPVLVGGTGIVAVDALVYTNKGDSA